MIQSVLEALPMEFQQFREGVEGIARLVLQARLFPPRHPSVERALSEAFLHLDVALQHKNSIKFIFANKVIYWLNFKLDLTDTREKSIHLFRETLARQSIGEIEFMKGMTKEELAILAGILARGGIGSSSEMASQGDLLRNIRIRNGRAAEESSSKAVRASADRVGEPHRGAKNLGPADGDGKMGKVVQGVLDKLEKIQSTEGTRAGAKIIEVVEREGGPTATILLLNSLREYDDYTFAHSVNVAVISAAVARCMSLPEEFIDAIAHAALLHDIGKLYVPRDIIHKTGRLTPSEWQVIKRHPVDGERILREERLDLLSRRVAYEHHMRHDLTGYPTTKEGFAVHKASEIVRIADSYDALTTRRPYRKQINPYEAIKLMAKGSGTEYHKDYFSAFLRVLGNVPIGSILKLNTGETVLVIDIMGGSGDLPRVRVLKDASDRQVDEEIIIDLNERDPVTNDPKRKIALIVDQTVRDVDVGQYISG
ncbi:MAG: HD-GYP domain-containing protein [Candidatus Krumholzibacteria bacterium]|nr:HD-GYP domain-containing protein [Candidatus Krumholzibacteria bacterium]